MGRKSGKSVSDDSASRKAPSKFDTNLVLYTQILPSAGHAKARQPPRKGDAHFDPTTLTLSRPE